MKYRLYSWLGGFITGIWVVMLIIELKGTVEEITIFSYYPLSKIIIGSIIVIAFTINGLFGGNK